MQLTGNFDRMDWMTVCTASERTFIAGAEVEQDITLISWQNRPAGGRPRPAGGAIRTCHPDLFKSGRLDNFFAGGRLRQIKNVLGCVFSLLFRIDLSTPDVQAKVLQGHDLQNCTCQNSK